MRALEFSQGQIARVIEPGDTVLDATCGNGKDTLFLAEGVGPGGKVFAFDIQDAAIEATAKLLAGKGLLERASMHRDSHENILQYIRVPLKAAMFNLGYLPGGDHAAITIPESTIRALEGALSLLLPRGLVSVVAYSGHPGGEYEKDMVREFLAKLDQRQYAVLNYEFINQINHPPQLFLIEKL